MAETEGLPRDGDRVLRVGWICLVRLPESRYFRICLLRSFSTSTCLGTARFLARLGIEMDVAAAPGREEHTAVVEELANELPPFHTKWRLAQRMELSLRETLRGRCVASDCPVNSMTV